jgi:two-component system, OmpR family, phosphate regulon sensor histidine kinase PhoR
MLLALQAVLATSPLDAATTTRITGRVLATFAAVALVAAGAVLVGARALTRALGRLRAAVLGRARGEVDLPLPDFSIMQLQDLASAVERLSARDAAREAQLRRDHAEIAVMLDTITDGILRIDSAGRVLRANPAAWELLGLRNEVLGQPIETQVRHAELRRILDRAAAGERIVAAEITLDERRLIVSARPLEGEAEERAGAVVAFVDLTEVRRLEGVRRDFVANVSHELKTPLTSIRGYIETLRTEDSLPDDLRRQFLDVAQKNADRLHRIVDDLLDLSRLESGGWRPEMQQVDAAAIIDDAWLACRSRAEERNIHVSRPAGPIPVFADPGGLQQVLSNLLDNALRHTPAGGRIDITASPVVASNGGAHGAAGRMAFEVRDSGAGIPTDALPRIFERFYRVDPARSRADGGTGLGLSIVKHLVESMGGDVSAESELGRGTAVRFRLQTGAEQ